MAFTGLVGNLMYNLEMERRIYHDEFGCNYIDDNDNIISLYDELDEDLEEYIKSRTHFLTLDNQENIDKFIYRYQGIRENYKRYQQEYDYTVGDGFGFFDNTNGSNSFTLIYKHGLCGLLYEDDFEFCLDYMQNKIPSFDNQKDIDEYVKECQRKLSS